MLKLVCDICGREIKKDETQYSLTLCETTKDRCCRESYDMCSDCCAIIRKEVENK